MRNRLQQLLNVHKGEWGLLIAFFVLIALNTAALEGADVVATSCYLERLEPVARGSDELGQLARVFVQMAIEVQVRQERLKIQVRELCIEIDQAKKARQVAEITETEYFQTLREHAAEMRKRSKGE